MRLVIISHTEHYLRDGTVVGWGATVREIDHLATLFDEVVHVAPLHDVSAPGGAIAYQSKSVRLRPVAPAGGKALVDKLSILRAWPDYVRTILSELPEADVVHVRCPANISMLALLVLSAVRWPSKRWYKYAGNWGGYAGEPWSYRLQRWWLRHRLSGGEVTVNGYWDGEPEHIHAFLNPCLTRQELQEGQVAAEEKQMGEPLRLLYVGRIEKAKGVERALTILQRLSGKGIDARLDLVGDGPERAELERVAATLGVTDEVAFHGWQPRHLLDQYYASAHIFLLPSNSEGWPKVLSEAMAYGVVPLASPVSSIPYYLSTLKTGRAIDARDIDAYVETIMQYRAHPDQWQEEARAGAQAAASFSYGAYLTAVQRLLGVDEGRDSTNSDVVQHEWGRISHAQ